ncbi:hypothetical protein CLU79DRAFT_542416 [Phycomyces nitens]|nr:hypothetical protein CLU79DRAFT_542416 [Phycomyces nitens]
MDTPSEANTTIPATMDPKIVPVSEDPVPNNQPVETHRRPPPPPPPPHFPYPHPGAFMNFLPPGWTEHTGPGGQLYWYNSMTGQSSWQRPLMPPGGFMGHPGMVPIAPPFVPPVVPKPAVKKTKKKIPGTHWLLVRTDDGLEFYFDKEKKQSVWEMPKELEEPIAKMKQEEKEAETKTPKEPVPTKPAKPTKEAEVGEKRKVEEETDEAKRQKTEDMEATEMTEEDIMWQLQNMDPDEIEDLGLKKEEPVVPQSAPVIAVAPVVEPRDSALSEEERVELFTEMLTEKDISPYSTWEKELPKLIGDRRYSLVQHSKRKNLFNNYCRLLAQEIKLKKANQKVLWTLSVNFFVINLKWIDS